jgi:hypothetical protein
MFLALWGWVYSSTFPYNPGTPDIAREESFGTYLSYAEIVTQYNQPQNENMLQRVWFIAHRDSPYYHFETYTGESETAPINNPE